MCSRMECLHRETMYVTWCRAGIVEVSDTIRYRDIVDQLIPSLSISKAAVPKLCNGGVEWSTDTLRTRDIEGISRSAVSAYILIFT